jgi:LDH2 family malate/lactate/ureidoglycolate dehydrogenase
MERNGDVTMISLQSHAATAYATNLLAGAGASPDNARVVAEHLVASDLRGVHTHGLLRVPQYVAELGSGEINGKARPAIVRRQHGLVLLDGQGSFGQVAARRAVGEAADAAGSFGIGLAATTRSGHAGRIGAYTEELAERGFLGLAFCSGPKSGHRVAPFGGIEGRLATNPISFGFPTGDVPIVADFSTSTVPEGVVRRLRYLGRKAPRGALQNAAGRATNDPSVLYTEPVGTILPLGGASFGHKGYALAVLVEVMTTVLAGEDPADGSRFGNNLTVVAVAVDEPAIAAGTELVSYLRNTKPADPDRPVLVPGDPERRMLERGSLLEVDRQVWDALAAVAARYGIDPPPEG